MSKLFGFVRVQEKKGDKNYMKAEELTWERIKELAELAAKYEKDFELDIDDDGSIRVYIN